MADELAYQAPGKALVSRTRTGKERLLGLLQGRDGLLPSYRREILEELRKGPASR